MIEPASAREAVSPAAAAAVVARVVANLELAVRAPRETLELSVWARFRGFVSLRSLRGGSSA